MGYNAPKHVPFQRASWIYLQLKTKESTWDNALVVYRLKIFLNGKFGLVALFQMVKAIFLCFVFVSFLYFLVPLKMETFFNNNWNVCSIHNILIHWILELRKTIYSDSMKLFMHNCNLVTHVSHIVIPYTMLDRHTYLVQNKLQNFHRIGNIRLKKKTDFF